MAVLGYHEAKSLNVLIVEGGSNCSDLGSVQLPFMFWGFLHCSNRELMCVYISFLLL